MALPASIPLPTLRPSYRQKGCGASEAAPAVIGLVTSDEKHRCELVKIDMNEPGEQKSDDLGEGFAKPFPVTSSHRLLLVPDLDSMYIGNPTGPANRSEGIISPWKSLRRISTSTTLAEAQETEESPAR